MKELLNFALTKGEAGEIYKNEQSVTSLSLVNGKVQKVYGKKTSELALRLVKDKNLGSAVSTSIEDRTIVDRALISCENQKSEAVKFSNQQPSQVKCHDSRVNNLSTEEMVAEGQRILDIFKEYDNNLIPDVYINKGSKNIHILNSEGFDHNYDNTTYSIGIYTKSPKGFMEVGDGYEGAKFYQFTPQQLKSIIDFHNLSQNRVGVATGKIPVIFSGSAMGSLMLRLLAGVKGGNVLKHISPLEGKLGEEIFAKGITIRDDGTMDWGLATCPFDDEGIATSNTILVENGVLKNYLVGTGDSLKLNMAPTGNSFKRTMFSQDIEDAPAVDNTNLLIEGSNIPDEELIKGIKRGIYVDSVMGAHTGNIIAGEFSLNVSCGYLIEDGKFVGKVMDTMVAGNIYQDFKKIIGLGTRLEVMRAIFYNLGYSPAVLFSELSVVGKG